MATEYASKVLTVSGIAAYLKIHNSTVYRLVRRGELPAFKVGKDGRFNIEAIDRWRSSEWGTEKPRRKDVAVNGTAVSIQLADLRVRAYQEWVREQVQALRKRDLEMLDWDNLADELEGWGRTQE